MTLEAAPHILPDQHGMKPFGWLRDLDSNLTLLSLYPLQTSCENLSLNESMS